MQFDIPAFDFQVSPLGGSEDFLFGAGTEFAGCTGERHFLVGGGGSFAALALQADLPAGGVQVDAGFRLGFCLSLALPTVKIAMPSLTTRL